MDLELTQKHVLITGGSRGIGLACAKAFLVEGASVTIIGRQQAHLEVAMASLQGGTRVNGMAIDLTDVYKAAEMVEIVSTRHGPIDVLVNAAGAAKRTPFQELNPHAYVDAMGAKFFSYVNVMDPVVKQMADRGQGSIVNVVGMGGKVATATHISGGAANAALMLASAALASAYASKGVRVNVVNPALTMTERLREGLAVEARVKGISEDEALAEAKARFPLGRLAAPEDVADAVVFLASARASYISGIALSIDGAATPLIVWELKCQANFLNV